MSEPPNPPDVGGREEAGPESAARVMESLNYYLGRDGKVLLHLHHPCKFSIIGCLKITVILGKITMFGHDLSVLTEKRSVQIFANESRNGVIIESKMPEGSKTAHFVSSLEAALDEQQIQKLYTSVKLLDTVILVEELELPFSKALAYMVPSDLPVTEKTATLFPEVMKHIKCAIAPPDADDMAEIGGWTPVQPTGKRMIVLGPGGLGKTRLAHFLTNKLLVQHDRVLFLDLDLGQNEFAPAGTVAAVVVKKPLLGRNYANSSMHPWTKIIHVGQPTSEHCKSDFLTAVRMLVDFADKSNLRDIPWIANTMGLFEGRGMEAAFKTLAIVRPTTVFCLASKDGDNHLIEQLKPIRGEYDYSTVLSPLKRSAKLSKNAKRYGRYRMLISYLSPVLSPPDFLFNTAQRHCLPLSSVVLGVNSMESEGALHERFTHALVALLCQLPHDPSTAVGCLQVSLHLPMQPAIGLGVVMDMDLREGKLYLLTPVPASVMGKVKVLQLSGVQAPQQMFMDRQALDHARAMDSLESAFSRLNEDFHMKWRFNRGYSPRVYVDKRANHGPPNPFRSSNGDGGRARQNQTASAYRNGQQVVPNAYPVGRAYRGRGQAGGPSGVPPNLRANPRGNRGRGEARGPSRSPAAVAEAAASAVADQSAQQVPPSPRANPRGRNYRGRGQARGPSGPTGTAVEAASSDEAGGPSGVPPNLRANPRGNRGRGQARRPSGSPATAESPC